MLHAGLIFTVLLMLAASIKQRPWLIGNIRPRIFGPGILPGEATLAATGLLTSEEQSTPGLALSAFGCMT
jgi:hypothetical protein